MVISTLENKVIYLYDLFWELKTLEQKKELPILYVDWLPKLEEVYQYEEEMYRQIEDELFEDGLLQPKH